MDKNIFNTAIKFGKLIRKLDKDEQEFFLGLLSEVYGDKEDAHDYNHNLTIDNFMDVCTDKQLKSDVLNYVIDHTLNEEDDSSD